MVGLPQNEAPRIGEYSYENASWQTVLPFRRANDTDIWSVPSSRIQSFGGKVHAVDAITGMAVHRVQRAPRVHVSL
jgi:hypothetical protein